MSFDDIDDDDFIEIARHVPRIKAALVMRCVELGRQKTRRIQFTLSPDLASEIGGPRYRVAYAPAKRLFRIKSDLRGDHELIAPGRGDSRLLRCLPPAGFQCVSGDWTEPEYYVDTVGKVLLVEVPQGFIQPPMKSLPAPTKSPEPKATPEVEPDPVLARTLGLTPMFPQEIGGVKLTPAEARIVEVLYRNPRASRDALMMATADDAAEDDRDERVIDVFIVKLRKKFEPLGIEISTIRGAGFAMPTGAKTFLAALIGENGK